MPDVLKRLQLRSLLARRPTLLQVAAGFYILHLHLIVKIALLELMAFGALFWLGWSIARREARLSFHILYFPLLVYALATMASGFVANQRMPSSYDGILWFKILILPGAIMLYRQVPWLRQFATYAFAMVAGGGACWGLLEFALLDRRDLDNRISGPSSHVMTYSGLLLPLSLMMLVLWWRQRKWWQGLACILSSITLLLTFTRSVWLGWLVALFVVMLASRARLAFYALPVLLLFITFMPLDLFSRMISTFDLKQTSNFDRIRMLEAGVEMIRDRPVFGAGPGNVKGSYALYRKHDAPRPRPPHLHNNVVQLWAERGVLALSAYLLLLALFIRECLRGWNGPGRIWSEVGLAAVVSLTVAGLFEFNFGDTEVLYLLLNIMAFVVVSLEQTQAQSNEQAPDLVPATT